MVHGIAGWPLRKASLSDIAAIVQATPVNLVEIPKDLLDFVSVKSLYAVLHQSNKVLSLAGTTDFTGLAGLSWDDYQRYLDLQLATARFLRCRLWRVFLQAATIEELKSALDRLAAYAKRCPDLEIVIETHGGFESIEEGFVYCLATSSHRFVVDFGNINDRRLCKKISEGGFGDRIAYFHFRTLPGETSEEEKATVWERRAERAYPDHACLWEPKILDGREAVARFLKRGQRRAPLHV